VRLAGHVNGVTAAPSSVRSPIPAIWALFGELLTATVLIVLVALAATEYIGARVPGFTTISEAARRYAEHGDYRLFVAVLLLMVLSAVWWIFHILLRL
jgi:hypothetical protein